MVGYLKPRGMKSGIFIILFGIALFAFLFTWWANHKVVNSAAPYVFDETKDLPEVKRAYYWAQLNYWLM